MNQGDCEIRRAFPEFIGTGDDDDYNIYIDECLGYFQDLIKNYKEEKGILCQIENKLCMTVNQTPLSYVTQIYNNLWHLHFAEQIPLRISKFHDQIELPNLSIANMLFDGSQDSIPWPTIGKIDLNTQETLIKLYNYNVGRVAKHEILLLWFPTLLKPYQQVLESLFQTQFALRLDQLYYIAIMGVSAHGCEQLYQLLIQQFKQADGDMNWIECGYEAIPSKLQKLDLVCKYLAQKPWETQLKICIQALLKSGWQLQELVHALMIFVFFNSLSCFSLGNGICKEIDLLNQFESHNTSFIAHNTPPRKNSQEETVFNEQVIKMLKECCSREQQEQLNQQKQQQQQQYMHQQQIDDLEIDEVQLKKLFKEKFLKYFDNTGELQEQPGYQVLRSSEYSFSLNTYPVLKEVCAKPTQAVFEFIKHIKNMTRNSFGQEGQISTGAFRKAIRVYGENIYRYQHDDVDYSAQMNKLLPRELKLYVKMVSQTPNTLQKQHIENIPLKINADELCHISLLTIAAKIETQLIYLSRALLEYL